MPVLIAGANGQLGLSLQSVLPKNSIAADREVMDITDYDKVASVLKTLRPSCVINAAAYTAVDKAEDEPTAAFTVNAAGAGNLARATYGLGVPLIHISTDYVFDGHSKSPYHAKHYTNPRSVYGKSKLAGENMVSTLNPRHFIVRTAWLYGHDRPNFVLKMLELSKTQPKLRVVNDQIGSPTYVPHLAGIIARMVSDLTYDPELVRPGVYHLAGEGQASWYELTTYLFEQLGITTPVVAIETAQFPTRAARPAYSVLSQNPPYMLPHWKQGVSDFMKGLSHE